MLSYTFMQIAFITGLLLSVIIPLVGQTCVLKRISSSGDALSHTALLGVSIGLLAGLSPLFIAAIVCVIASFVIEIIRKKFSKYSELSVSIVMSISIALAAIISSKLPNSNFNSYLFGSILLIKEEELIFSIVIFVLTIAFYVSFYHQIRYIAFSEEQALLDGVKTNLINILITIITALVIAISSKVVGALMVSALMIIPYASAIQLTKSYKKSMILSIMFSVISVSVGLTTAFYMNLQPGGTIVLIAAVILVASLSFKQITKRMH